MKKVVLIFKVISLIFLLFDKSRAELFDIMKDTANSANCVLNVNKDQSYKDCTKKVPEDWKAETNVQKQTCCTALALLNCLLEKANNICSDSEYQSLVRAKKVAQQQTDKSCIVYRESPAMCGSNGIHSVLLFIMISVFTVIGIS